MADIRSQLLEQVQQALAEKRCLNISGGDSKLFLGPVVLADRLNVSDHSGVVGYQPDELVITARAGTTIDEISAVLAEHGQSLPSEPPSFNGKATLGGTLACHLSGPARPWAGSFRDHVLGIRLINGFCEHLRFGGQVMKNVAGYDVARMQAGAMGIFGVITEISCKVMPKPVCALTLTRQIPVAQALELMNQKAKCSTWLTGACWFDGSVYLRISGSVNTIQNVAAQWQGDTVDDADFWLNLNNHQTTFFENSDPLWRFSVKPSAAHFLADSDWLFDWAGGQRWLKGNYELQELESLAEKAGGYVCQFNGPARGNEIFHTPSAEYKALLIRLKQAFDPYSLFNPGRLYSWL